jgi:hypothetical protein
MLLGESEVAWLFAEPAPTWVPEFAITFLA